MNAHPNAVLFLCPQCSCLVRAAGSMAGRRSACPNCDKPVVIPTVPNVVQADAPTWPELPALAPSH